MRRQKLLLVAALAAWLAGVPASHAEPESAVPEAAWEKRLSDMRKAYEAVRTYESRQIAIERKARAWQRFLDTYHRENPISDEDREMRRIARARLEVLRAAATPLGEASGAEDPLAQDPAIRALDEFIARRAPDTSSPGWRTRLPRPPRLRFDRKRSYTWVLETNAGILEIELMPQAAPMHVSSTLYLTRLGFYDGLAFHRVIPGFMAQGGDPFGNGSGGPGYQYEGEFDPALRHDRGGLLSMANRGPGTDGSQFFLTFAATPHLDDKHTIFGQLVKGKPTLARIEKTGSASGTPSSPLRIERARITIGPS